MEWFLKSIKVQVLCLLLVTPLAIAMAQQNVKLTSVDVAAPKNGKSELRFSFTGAASVPTAFDTDEGRIVLDFSAGRDVKLQKVRNVDNGTIQKVVLADAGQDKTRAVIFLDKKAKYTTRKADNQFIVSFGGEEEKVPTKKAPRGKKNTGKTVLSRPTKVAEKYGDVAFKRDSTGSAVIEIDLKNVNGGRGEVIRRGNRIFIGLPGKVWRAEQERVLDVADFATAVNSLKIINNKGIATVDVLTQSNVLVRQYSQSGKLFVSVQKPNVVSQAQAGVIPEKKYEGELISLNFQDIEVRSVLQIIADFTNLNMVVTDNVQGNVTVRLENVPWDQALETVLRSKGLIKHQEGNVIFVGSAKELEAMIRGEVALQNVVPPISETIQINYAKAEDIANVIRRTGSANRDGYNSSMLSPQGSVNVEARTNKLLITDTPAKVSEVRRMIAEFDIPVRQVLIDSKIVIASSSFARDLGIKWGGNAIFSSDGTSAGLGGVGSSLTSQLNSALNGSATNIVRSDFANLGVAGSSGLVIGFLNKNVLLDMELSAQQSESKAETLSNPKVLTSDRQPGKISQGKEIAYNKSDDSGNTTIEFKKVELSLDVTPQITPDGQVILDLEVKKDSLGTPASDGQLTVDTQSVKTRAMVGDGETMVLGGIYEDITKKSVSKVPWLGDLPAVGRFFRNNRASTERAELLIFVTPHIVRNSSDVIN